MNRFRLIFNLNRSRSNSSYVYTPINECINICRNRDYENYLCTLLINNIDLKRFALALRSFNSELASIKDVSRNRDVAKFRFQYWSDTVDKLFQSDYYPPVNEPITTELKRCLQKVNLNLSPHWFRRLIESRKQNLSNFPFSTVQELEQYEEQSVSSIYYLLIEYAIRLGCLKSNSQNISRIDLDHIASHLGKSQGILNVLRGLYRNALHEESFIPNDLLAKHRCTHEDLIRLCYQLRRSSESNKKLSVEEMEQYRFGSFLDLFFELATLSKQNLNTALRIYNEHKLSHKRTNYLFLPIYLQNTYLNELERNEFNVFNTNLFTRYRSTLPIRLYLNSFEFIKLK